MPLFWRLLGLAVLDRRNFIKVCGGASVAAAASGCLPTVQYPQFPIGADKAMSIPLNAFTPVQPYVLAHHPESRFPVCVYRLGDGEYSASLLQCRHRPCEVAVKPQSFVCPCHGSRYSHRGELEKGPAEMSLKTYPVRVQGEVVAVTLDDVSFEFINSETVKLKTAADELESA